jgi:protein phosphatase
MGSGSSMQAIADTLIRKANENGGVDNITVVAFKVEGAGAKAPAPPTATDEPTGDETIIAPAVVVPSAEPAEPAAAPPAAKPQTVAGANGNGQPAPASPSSAFDARRAESKKSRRWVGAVIVSIVLLIGIGGAVIGSLNVYFLGGNEKGLVTVYRGLPYDLPLSISLYTRDFVTTVPVSELPDDTRAKILDHKLRTRSDALDLAQQIEKGKINLDDLNGVNPDSSGSGGATAP